MLHPSLSHLAPLPSICPSNDIFPAITAAEYSRENAQGAIVVRQDRIRINQGRYRLKLRVTNNGDRPIQVVSHYHFIETNSALAFDRGKAYGKRLDIAAGTAVRFEPRDTKTVTLCAIVGAKIIGGNMLAAGVVDLSHTDEIVKNLVQKGFGHVPEPWALEVSEDTDMGRDAYVAMFGPTVGDQVRLRDSALWIEVERDLTVYGDEVKFGGGKTIREGMGQATGRSAPRQFLDLLPFNALMPPARFCFHPCCPSHIHPCVDNYALARD